MEKLHKRYLNGKIEYWYDITEYTKEILGPNIHTVQILIMICDEPNDAIASSIFNETLEIMANSENILTIPCKAMELYLKNGEKIAFRYQNI